MPKLMTKGLVMTALMMLGGVAQAQPQDAEISRGRATFRSEAPLETINGVSNGVTGTLRFDPSNLAATRGRIVMRVDTLRTGIELRDEHLHGSEWLDARRHPEAVFEITGVSGATTLASGREVTMQVRGRFTLKGQTKDVTAEARVRWDGSNLRGRARFSIRLSDYNITINEAVRLKVSNEVQVTVDLRVGEG